MSLASKEKGKAVQTNDPKTWPLGRYFWGTILYALKNNQVPPTLEFYFNGLRSLTLRIDRENSSQFLLCNQIEGEQFIDKDSGKQIDIEGIKNDDDLPSSRWNSLGFDAIIKDEEEDDKGNLVPGDWLFASEIEGKEKGIVHAIDIACQVFADYCKKGEEEEGVHQETGGGEDQDRDPGGVTGQPQDLKIGSY